MIRGARGAPGLQSISIGSLLPSWEALLPAADFVTLFDNSTTQEHVLVGVGRRGVLLKVSL